MAHQDHPVQISLVYQNPEEMFIKDSIRADIGYAMQVRGLPDWRQRTDSLLERFRLGGLSERDGRLMLSLIHIYGSYHTQLFNRNFCGHCAGHGGFAGILDSLYQC